MSEGRDVPDPTKEEVSEKKKEHENTSRPNQGQADESTDSLDQDKKQKATPSQASPRREEPLVINLSSAPQGPPLSPYPYPYHYSQPFMSPLPYNLGASPNETTSPSHSKTSLGGGLHSSPVPYPFYAYPYYPPPPPPPPPPTTKPTSGTESASGGATRIASSEQRDNRKKEKDSQTVQQEKDANKNTHVEKPKSDEHTPAPDSQHLTSHGSGYPTPSPGGYYHPLPPPYYYPPPYGQYPYQYPPPGPYLPPYGRDPVGQSVHNHYTGETNSAAPVAASPQQVNKGDDDDNNASDGVLPIYVRSSVVSKEILERRRRKNSSARAHEAQKRERVAQILQKPEHERTHEEISLLEKVSRSRERKNNRSRERAVQVHTKILAILEKPPEERTNHEIQFLNIHMNRKKHKYEGDRLRRQRYKSLGFNARSKVKLGLNARGPLPSNLKERIEEHVAESYSGGSNTSAAVGTSRLTPHAYNPQPMMNYFCHPE